MTTAQSVAADVRTGLSPAQFRAEYRGRKPVVIRGAIADMPAVSTWSAARLAEAAPDQRVRVKVGTVSEGRTAVVRLADYARDVAEWESRAADDPGDPPPYLHDVPLLSLIPELRHELEPFPLDYFPPFFRDQWWSFTQFFVGPARAQTPLHFDSLLTHNLFFQIQGAKRFVMVADAERDRCYTYNWRWASVDPEAPDLDRYPRFRDATVMTCEVEAGDILYMPPGTLHKVISPGASISFNIDWHDRASALRGLAAIRDGMPLPNLRYNAMFALGVVAGLPRRLVMPGLRSYYSYIS